MMLLMTQFQLICGIILLFLEIIGMREVLVRYLMPKHNLLPKFDGTLDLILIGVSFHVEETILEIFGTLAGGQAHIVT